MENQSRNQTPRRQRGNRSGGRNRGRNRNSSQQQGQGGQSPSSRSRRRKRKGGATSSKSTRRAKPSFLRRLLSLLSFGLLGRAGGKRKAKAKSGAPRHERSPAAARASGSAASPAERPRRTDQLAEVTSARLYIGNLDYSTGEAELEELFRGVGNVISTEVVTNPRTQQSKGFAFVEMGSIDEAKRAVSVLDDQDFRGRRLVVSGARSESSEEASGATSRR